MEAGASQPAISCESPAAETTVASDVALRVPKGRRLSIVAIVVLGLVAGGVYLAQRVHAPSGEPAPATEAGAPVAVAPIVTDEMTARRRYPGELFADAVELGSRVAGHVETIDVRIGDEVQAGQVIATIDDALIERRITETRAQIAAQRSQVKASEVAKKAAKRDLSRLDGLLSKGAVSEQEVDDLRTALDQRDAAYDVAQSQLKAAQARLSILREDLKDTSVAAPFSGVIARRDVDPGAFVEAGAPLVRLVAHDPLRVRFSVPEHELADVREGLKFSVYTRAAKERPPQGEVTRISGEVTRADRTLLVEGLVADDDLLRPGMYVDVELEMRRLSGVPIVPEAAVVERIEADGTPRVGVFVLDESTARWQDVVVLAREGGRVAVEPAAAGERLDPTDRVLVRGHRELQDGATVRVVDEQGAAEADS